MPYNSEHELIEQAMASQFYRHIGDRSFYNGNFYQIKEMSGIIGIPDLILVKFLKHKKNSIQLKSFSFEFKLYNWKRALTQAYRYKAFNHKSYVIMDHKYVHRAIDNLNFFIRSNIGLASIDGTGTCKTFFIPKTSVPYSSDLYNKFREAVINKTLN